MKTIPLICSLVMAASPGQKAIPRDISSEEASIYELLVANYGGDFVVSNDMISERPDELVSTWKYITNSNGNMWPAVLISPALKGAFEDLASKSKTRWRIRTWPSKLHLQTRLLPQKYPPVTVFWFSPIGFDQSKNIAVVIRSGQQGPLAGSTEFIILRKNDGVWEVEHERSYRIS